ncbi:MAG: hypothetical protein COU82_01960 [Candidatus Portnoybacteria bacterium CG10_big_fil_rev_8_21_14_0_10_38_18]|uniref:Uncharacterized protein n=1 Tax=Candidatus Portnoybacteria bacterium CG10_big_fil_rev_8_21_14_0_10_38_18 TaxID=1974813 RepID=A0A2M8KC15_9BACT|nr:MAG: hypothetical protein COU82_01960 [Candidatus Portnoybacteria bacterium CG10_big_fil_rev_8_21_14_0_10_38_18]
MSNRTLGDIIFSFLNVFGSRFHLDGTFLTFASVKPGLRPGKRYRARYLEKENGFLKAELLGNNDEPQCLIIIEAN